MNELDLQDKYLVNFLCERQDGLQYKEAKANTVSAQFFLIEDLKHFLSETTLNKDNYKKLLKKFGSEKELLDAITDFLEERVKSSTNMALFINTNKTVTFEGVSLHLFYPSGSETQEDKLFNENVFSVIQELPYTFKYEGKQRFSFRPDLTFFLNGIFLGYSELKSNYTNQNARNNGRKKVAKDYLTAVQEYLEIADGNDISQTIRKDFLKIFEKAIHITSTDINETYVIRNISNQFDEIKSIVSAGNFDFNLFDNKLEKDFKQYPLRNKEANKIQRFEEVFKALYDKKMIEKEILYYNFLERELVKKEGSKTKEYKHNDGRLISPRPKQKFGADKILSKIDEFLEHENEPDYFINKLEKELKEKGVGAEKIKELITKRQKYQNNKNIYSLLLQYSAGFGKSNIIGWTALQLKDLRKDGEYVYDKIMLVVDRLQLRDQLDTMLHNMNIQKGMFIEAYDKKTFTTALSSDKRVVIVNVQKFGTVNEILDSSIVTKLSKLRIAFLIDEIHRSNSGVQHEEMISVFDELQSSFDNNSTYSKTHQKKNLIVGFTATPSDHTLARFGEFNKYAEAEKLWIPFDSYTMKEAIDDGYVLNPIKGIVPVSSKMYFEKPENDLEGFEGDMGYEAIPDNTDTGIDEYGKKYAIRKKKIYANPERIEAISKFIVERLVTTVYHNIRGTAKAMLATTSIPNAISYSRYIKKHFKEITKQKKYERFKDAPIYIVYSDSQDQPSSNNQNDGVNEKSVLQNFKLAKNGLIIVVDKLQTGYDEPKLHTLFLDKEIRGINAIQTISRVNRTTKYKNDCKIVDFSYKNVNVKNIKEAFEHFSNVVVSDFDPLGDEGKLEIYFKELKEHILYTSHYKNFISYQQGNKDINLILEMENSFADYITKSKPDAKKLKATINSYFKILNLIEFVIELDGKYSDSLFLEFWRKFNYEYNHINKPTDIIDDVEIYFDNKIGIVAPQDYKDKDKTKKEVKGGAVPTDDNKYKFNILKVIEKRNQEEEAIADLIEQPLDFEIPEQKIMLAIYLVAPEVDNDRRALNVFHGMRRAKKEGRWIGVCPKGYRNTRDACNKPIIVPEAGKDEALIKKAYQEFSTGLFHPEELRKHLKKDGMKLSKNAFVAMLKNKAYIGKIFLPAYKDESAQWVDGIHESLIGDELFYDVQDVFLGRSKKNFPNKIKTVRDELPLRGYLECPRCAKPLTGSASTGRSGVKFYYYHCSKGCKERIKALDTNDVFAKKLRVLRLNSVGVDLIMKSLKTRLKSTAGHNKSELEGIVKDIEKNKQRIKNA